MNKFLKEDHIMVTEKDWNYVCKALEEARSAFLEIRCEDDCGSEFWGDQCSLIANKWLSKYPGPKDKGGE